MADGAGRKKKRMGKGESSLRENATDFIKRGGKIGMNE